MVKSAGGSASWRHAPAPLKQAVGLLYLQATIWAFLSAGIVVGESLTLARTPDSKVTTTVVTVLLALATGTFAAAKFRLAYRLPRGSHKTREAVITVETLMATFAGVVLLGLFISVTGLILSPPFIIGGVMSARVARGLAKPPARQYFDANQARGAQTGNARLPDSGDSPVQFYVCLAAT
jgi:hypothetical protein